MPRNPKHPQEYVANPRDRADEKLSALLKFLAQLHHSTRKLMLRYLGLATHSHHTYFKKLVERGILQRVRVYSINCRHVYMLTALGRELAAESMPEYALNYSINPNSINYSGLRHDLAIQKAIIDRRLDCDEFVAEKYLPNLELSEKKLPDACLIKDEQKTMLEIELTPKNNKLIFRAFNAHAEALLDKKYQQVLYIFPSAQLCKYYQKRFNQPKWPFYKQNQRGLWVKQDDSEFVADDHTNLRQQFSFIYENDLADSF